MTHYGLVSEARWFEVLESSEPVHQWGPALLVPSDRGEGLLDLWLRDDSGEGLHRVIWQDAHGSERARQGIAQIEAAARRVADLIAAEQERGASNPTQLAETHDASAAYVETAEALYRELAAGPT